MSLSKPIHLAAIPAQPGWNVVVLDRDKLERKTGDIFRFPVIAWQIEIFNRVGSPGELVTSVVPITPYGIIEGVDCAVEYDGKPPLFGEDERFDSVAAFVEHFAPATAGRRR